jgi:hypothetical protein
VGNGRNCDGEVHYKYIERATTRHGKTVYYFRRGKGDRARLPDEYGSAHFKSAYFAALRGEPIPHVREFQKPETAERIRVIRSAVKKAGSKAKVRAKRKGMRCDIDSAWALNKIEAAGYRCELSGIPFLKPHDRASFMHPFIPSVDRKNPALGYTKENCRIVIFALNVMISDWGEEIMLTVARAYSYTENKRRRSYPHTLTQEPLTSEK